MTIFDKLKYQISNPPTKAELDALPRPLLNQCLEKIGLDPDLNAYEASWYLGVFTDHPDEKYHRVAENYYKTIMKTIEEYDNLPYTEVPNK